MATVKVRITGDASGLKSSVDESEGLIARLGRSFAGIGTAVATAGAAIGGLGIALGAKIGVDSVKAASDLEQSVGGVEAVFGSAADKVLEFGKTADKQFGMSANAVNQLTAPVGALLSGLGFTQDQAADTSIQLASLGADLAAAFGGTAEEAVSALGSTLRGEYDPAERFGVALSAAAVEAKAMEMGLASSTKELTAQQKAQATLALIMERTKNVQGQAAREADTFAGKTARLGATLENLKARIGQQLLPVAVRFAGVVSDVIIPALEKWGPVIAQKIAPVLGELAGSFRAMIAAFQSPAEGITSSGLAGFFERVGIAARVAFDWLRSTGIPILQQLVGFIAGKLLPAVVKLQMQFYSALLPVLAAVGRFIMAEVVPALQRFGQFVISDVVPALQQFAGWLRDNVLPVLAAIGRFIVNDVVPAVQAFAGWVRDSLIPALAAFGEWVLSKIIPILRDLADWFNTKIRPALEDVRDAFMNDLLPALAEAWSWISDKLGPIMRWLADEIAPKVWDHLQKIANIVMDYVVPAFIEIQKKVAEFIVKLVEVGIKIGAFVVGAIDDVGRFVGGVGEKIGEAIEFFRGLPGRITDAIGDLGSLLYDAGADIIRGLIDGIRSMFGRVTDVVSEAANLIPGPIKSVLGINSPSTVFAGFGENLMQGLSLGIQSGLAEVRSTLAGAALGITPQAAPVAVGSGGSTYNVTVNGLVASDLDMAARTIREAIRRVERAQR